MARRQPAVLAGIVVMVCALPASASAAEVMPNSSGCFRYIEAPKGVPAVPTFGLTTSGWAPGAPLEIRLGTTGIATGQADAAGQYASGDTLAPPAPPEGKNLISTRLTVTDGAGNVAERAVKIVRLTVQVPNGKVRAGARVRYRAFGFNRARKVFLFVRRANKTKGRFILGWPKGACGTVTKRMRFMPLKRFTPGLYDFLYTQTKKYSAGEVLYGYSIRIYPTR
jgi:hypothetical protein